MAQTTSQALGAALSGLSFRNNLNTILAALFSGNSGASAPSPTVGGQFWLDSGVSPPVLRVRNNANTAWLVVNPETIPAATVRGNSSGSAAAEGSIDMATLRTMLGFPTASAGLGEWVAQTPATGVALVLPAGGTWAYAAYRFSSGLVAAAGYGVAAGGTSVGAAVGGQNWSGFAWRVA